MTTLSVLSLLQFGGLPDLLLALVGLTFLSGAFVVPFVWFSIRRRRELVLAPLDVDADRTGITLATPIATTRHAWSVYRRAREIPDGFLLDTGIGANVMVAKRGAAESDVDAFRTLLREVNLLRPSSMGMLTWLVWLLVGIGAGVGFTMLLPVLLG
jgi:prepilin signal peptidase PulO-like enzyme (type II secretory pathway)